MADYEIILRRDDGTALGFIETFTGLRYALLINDVSACQITLPGSFDTNLLEADRRLEIWRRPAGAARVREGIWFIRKIKDYTLDQGERKIEVTGYSPNYLLGSRIVAYAAKSSQSEKSTYLDDMMKAIVNQNLSTAATSTARRLSTGYLTIAPNLSAAPVRTKGFAWRNVLAVLKDLAETSKGAGTDLYFDMVPVNDTSFEFRTFTGQMGMDHTFPNGVNPVMLGLEYGNMSESSVEQDWSEEATFVYAGGQGEESTRIQATAEDTARSGRSVFGRREVFADARNVPSSTGVAGVAQQYLSDRRPRLRFMGTILDVPSTHYGVHWRHGDMVSAFYYGQQYDCLVRSVEVWVDEEGHETIDSRLEITE